MEVLGELVVFPDGKHGVLKDVLAWDDTGPVNVGEHGEVFIRELPAFRSGTWCLAPLKENSGKHAYCAEPEFKRAKGNVVRVSESEYRAYLDRGEVPHGFAEWPEVVYLRVGQRVMGPWRVQRNRRDRFEQLVPWRGAGEGLVGCADVLPHGEFKSFGAGEVFLRPTVRFDDVGDAMTVRQLGNWVKGQLDVAANIERTLLKDIAGHLKALGRLEVNSIEAERWRRVPELLRNGDAWLDHLEELDRKFFEEARQRAEARVKKELRDSNQELEALRVLQRELRESVAALKGEVAKKEELAQEAEQTLERLERFKKELLPDLLSLRDVLGEQTSVRSPQAPNPPTEEFESSSPLSGSAIENEARFLKRLKQCLRSSGINPGVADCLHELLKTNRSILVRDGRFAAAYRDAMGGGAVLHVAQVEVTWLTFSDGSPAILPAWHAAAARPDRLHLLLLQDFDRALPELWARPIVDLLTGVRKKLPACSVDGWPDNLRVLASPAQGTKSSLPVSEWFVENFAACNREVGPAATGEADDVELVVGHVDLETWRSWEKEPGTRPTSYIEQKQPEWRAQYVRREESER